MIRGVLRRSEDLGSGSDQTMFSTLLLLLLTATSGKCVENFGKMQIIVYIFLLIESTWIMAWMLFTGIKCIELVQPAVMLVKPGESFSVPCKITGYSATSQCTNWIRQSGQKLELIGWYCSSSDTGSSDSLKNKIRFSADASTNTVTLHGQNFQTEDTAVYYCARNSQWDRSTKTLYKNIQYRSLLEAETVSYFNVSPSEFLRRVRRWHQLTFCQLIGWDCSVKLWNYN